MSTWGELKASLRLRLWPDGEATELVVPHDALFIDAIMDLQKWVPCLQQDNTQVIPHCATYYKCGITVLDAPRGYIKQLSVIDHIDQETGLEDPESDLDYCREIVYTQIDPCNFQRFWKTYQSGCCCSISSFFALPCGCDSLVYPTPSDADLPPGLPALPLGYRYPQTSTDRANNRRSPAGVWALERGKLYVAPWIQSSEVILLKWDGLKRSWNDSDLIDDDPDLAKAILEYVRYQHMDKFEKDPEEMIRAMNEYNSMRAILIRECKEETRVRLCEPSFARSSTASVTTLYYNDTEGVGHAECPSGQTGDAQSVTVAIGTVASPVSVAEANQMATDQAQAQAEARLVCTGDGDGTVTYWNDRQDAVAQCLREAGAPKPDGPSIVRVVEADTVSSTVSKADADQKAAAQAQADADAALIGQCTWKNRATTATAVCPYNAAITAIGTVAEGEFTSTTSQATADGLAQVEAQNRANDALDALGTCAAAPPLVGNTRQTGTVRRPCVLDGKCCAVVFVDWSVEADYVTARDQTEANNAAISIGIFIATVRASRECGLPHPVTRITLTIPGSQV